MQGTTMKRDKDHGTTAVAEREPAGRTDVIQPPDTETGKPPAGRRLLTMLIAVTVATVLVIVAAVLLLLRPATVESPGGWDGDWKDLIGTTSTQEGGTTSSYTGDWKDTVEAEQRQARANAASTARLEGLAEHVAGGSTGTPAGSAPVYTGDWKDMIGR